MRAKNAAEMVRDMVATIEARETYETRMVRLRRDGAFRAARVGGFNSSANDARLMHSRERL